MVVGQAIKLLDFINQHQHLSKEDFLSHYPFPFLLVPGDQEMTLPKMREATEENQPVAPPQAPNATMRMSFLDMDDTLPPSFRKVVVDKAVVIPLPLRETAPRQLELTIGRTEERDLYFEDEKISIHHSSLLSRGEPPMYFLVDHNSTNGTYINGMAMEPEKEYRLKDQASLEFGLNNLFIFYHSATLFKCIHLL